MTSARRRRAPLFDPAIVRQAIVDSLPQADAPAPGAEPGDVRGRGRAASSPRCCSSRRWSARAKRRPASSSAISLWLWFTRALRQLRRGDGRGPRQGPGRDAAQGAPRRPGQAARASRSASAARRDRLGRQRCARATSCWSRPATSSPATARSSRASPRSTRAPSPARARRSSARAAATAARSPAARGCCRTGWSCESPPIPGETFLDRMIALVEGAKRQKTPNEIALDILLAALTIIFLLATVTLLPFSLYSVAGGRPGHAGHRHRAGGAAGLPDPDHHRRRCSRPSASPAWTA